MADAASGSTPSPDSASTPTPVSGWYPDPADPRYLRWWDGVTWTAHLGPPASPLAAQRPLISEKTPVYNAYIWTITGLPLLMVVLFLSWNPEIRFYTTSKGTTSPDPSSLFNVGYFLLWGGLVVVYGASIALAALDYRRLVHVGVLAPFHWAWAFLGGVVYVIGRAAIVNKVAPGRGWWPVGVIFAAWLLYVVVGSIKAMTWMQSMFSQMGYGP